MVVRHVEAYLKRRGYDVIGFERTLPNGRCCDLLFRGAGDPGCLYAGEIASGSNDDEVRNIALALQQPGGADMAWSVAFTQALQRRIKREVRARCGDLWNRIDFRLAAEFIQDSGV